MENGNLEKLIVDFKESLEREIREGFAAVNSRLDTQSARLDRQGAYWQTGRRWSARMDDWAETVDAGLEARAREIAELRQRIADLENKLR